MKSDSRKGVRIWHMVWMGVGLWGMATLALPQWAEARDQLWSSEQASRHGLVRAWFGQVQMDPGRSRVQYLGLYEDVLLVQTDRAMLHAFHAETGRTLWAVLVGSPDRPSLQPGINAQLVAVVNGATLFLLNRADGKILWKTALEGFPGAGPSLSPGHVYVPMLQGLVYAYPLIPAKDPREALGELRSSPQKKTKETPEERLARMAEFRLSQEKNPPLVCQSQGHTMTPVRVGFREETQEFVAWPSHLGYLFIGVLDKRLEKFTIRHRLQTEKPISAPPAYLPPDPKKISAGGVFFVGNHDGYVWAVSEKTGEILWKFPTGRIIEHSPVLIDQQLFVATVPGGIYCLEALTGKQLWYVPDLVQFVAASKQRVYATDRLSRLHVLDRAKGTRLDMFSVLGQILLANTENDRIYMATPSGLVQCLHEVELTEPVVHGAARKSQERPAIIQQEAFPKPEEKVPAPSPKAEEESAPNPKTEEKPEEKEPAPSLKAEEKPEEESAPNPKAEEKPKGKEDSNPFQL